MKSIRKGSKHMSDVPTFQQVTLSKNKTELEGRMLTFCPVSSLEKAIFDSKSCRDI